MRVLKQLEFSSTARSDDDTMDVRAFHLERRKLSCTIDFLHAQNTHQNMHHNKPTSTTRRVACTV